MDSACTLACGNDKNFLMLGLRVWTRVRVRVRVRVRIGLFQHRSGMVMGLDTDPIRRDQGLIAEPQIPTRTVSGRVILRFGLECGVCL